MTVWSRGPVILQLPVFSGPIEATVLGMADRVAAEFARSGALVVLMGHADEDYKRLIPLIGALGGTRAGRKREQRQTLSALACKPAALLALRLHTLGVRAVSLSEPGRGRSSGARPRLISLIRRLLAGHAMPVVAVPDRVSMCALREAVAALPVPASAHVHWQRVNRSVEPMAGIDAQCGERLDNVFRNPETVGRLPAGSISSELTRAAPEGRQPIAGATPSVKKFEYVPAARWAGKTRSVARRRPRTRACHKGKHNNSATEVIEQRTRSLGRC